MNTKMRDHKERFMTGDIITQDKMHELLEDTHNRVSDFKEVRVRLYDARWEKMVGPGQLAFPPAIEYDPMYYQQYYIDIVIGRIRTGSTYSYWITTEGSRLYEEASGFTNYKYSFAFGQDSKERLLVSASEFPELDYYKGAPLASAGSIKVETKKFPSLEIGASDVELGQFSFSQNGIYFRPYGSGFTTLENTVPAPADQWQASAYMTDATVLILGELEE
jgi:hypothetical protein